MLVWNIPWIVGRYCSSASMLQPDELDRGSNWTCKTVGGRRFPDVDNKTSTRAQIHIHVQHSPCCILHAFTGRTTGACAPEKGYSTPCCQSSVTLPAERSAAVKFNTVLALITANTSTSGRVRVGGFPLKWQTR